MRLPAVLSLETGMEMLRLAGPSEEGTGKAEKGEFPQIREVLFQEKGEVLDRKINKWLPLG